MNSFYVHLPSHNVSSTDRSNTPYEYQVQLCEPIKLDGEWQVGLVNASLAPQKLKIKLIFSEIEASKHEITSMRQAKIDVDLFDMTLFQAETRHVKLGLPEIVCDYYFPENNEFAVVLDSIFSVLSLNENPKLINVPFWKDIYTLQVTQDEIKVKMKLFNDINTKKSYAWVPDFNDYETNLFFNLHKSTLRMYKRRNYVFMRMKINYSVCIKPFNICTNIISLNGPIQKQMPLLKMINMKYPYERMYKEFRDENVQYLPVITNSLDTIKISIVDDEYKPSHLYKYTYLTLHFLRKSINTSNQ